MKRVLFILLSVLPLLSLAQGLGGVYGITTDAKTGKIIPSVEIVISPKEKGLLSDKEGKYRITAIEPGEYTISARYLGYIPLEKKIKIETGKLLELNLKFDIDIKLLLEVEIRDDKIEMYAYSKVVLKEADLEQRPIRDIADYMREVPNISAVRKGGANLDPVIRGFKYSQLNIQLDNGQKMEGGCPNRMDPTTSHVEAGDIEAIEVLKGPFALRYGPVMGGVVNLLTSNPRPFQKFQIHVKANMGYESNWNGQRQHLTVFGGGKKVFFTVSGNNAKYGNYTDGNGNKQLSSFNKFGYNGKLGFTLSKNHRIVFSYSEFYARNVMFPALPMDERTDNTKLYSFDYSGKNISKLIERVDFKAYFSDVDHTMDNKNKGKSDTVIAVSQIIAKRMGYRAEAGLNTGRKSHLFVGTDMYRIDKDGDRVKTIIGQYPIMGKKVPVKYEKLWNNAVISNYGLFAEYRYNQKAWEIVGSMRFDYNTSYSDSITLYNMKKTDIIGTPADKTKSDFFNTSFSLGVSRKLNDNTSLGLSIGRGVRSPDMLERFIITLPVGYDNYEYIGNPGLKPESNNEVDLVFKYKNLKYGSVEITGFYSYVQNYIGGKYVPPAIQKPLTADVIGVKTFDNLGNASLYGFELSYATPVRYKFRASVTAAYTQGTIAEVDALEFDNNGNVVDRITIKNDPLGEIPPMNLNVNLSYKMFKSRVIPAINFRYSAKQDRVSVAMQELTTTDFALIDFNLLYKYSKHLSLIGGVNNVLNKSYFEHLNRRILGSNNRIYEPGRVLFINLIFNI